MEFQFNAGADWDSVYFGRILDQLPELTDIETLRQASFLIGPEQLAFGPQTESKRFWRADRSLAVTVGPELLAVSVLPPNMPGKHSWERLRDTAFRVLKVYESIARPGSIRQTGLRYINALSIDPQDFRVDTYISEASGLVAPVILRERNPFSCRMERVTAVTRRYHLREVITLAAEPDGRTGGRLILDVDQLAGWPQGAGANAARPVYERMHLAVHNVFTRAIQPHILASFGPLEPSGTLIEEQSHA